MADRTMKQGDTWPPFEGTLSADLTDAVEVRMWMRRQSDGYAINTDPCDITDAPAGKVIYLFSAEETSLPGVWDIEWEVEWDDEDGPERIQTFPHDSYRTLEIIPALDPTEEP